MSLEHYERGKQQEGDTKAEWKRQAQNLARLFAEELGLTSEGYIAGLPEFGPQPENFRDRFDIPVIVETRIPLPKMLELVGITCYFNSEEIKVWPKGNFVTPEQPYIVWLNDGSTYLGRSVKEVRKGLAPDERGGTVFDGIALYLQKPEILEHYSLDFPGSQVGSGDAPYLNLWSGGRPGLSWGSGWVDLAIPNVGPVSCGRI